MHVIDMHGVLFVKYDIHVVVNRFTYFAKRYVSH